MPSSTVSTTRRTSVAFFVSAISQRRATTAAASPPPERSRATPTCLRERQFPRRTVNHPAAHPVPTKTQDDRGDRDQGPCRPAFPLLQNSARNTVRRRKALQFLH